MKLKLLALVCCLSLLVAACASAENSAESPSPVATEAVAEAAVEEEAPSPTATVQPTTPPTDTPVPATPTEEAVTPTPTQELPTPTTAPALEALPAEPQRIEFESEDGTLLVGSYYPAAINPAPAIVLIHWAGGDQTDWQYVGMAAWLQNRGLEIPGAPGGRPYDTPYPFPPLPEARSFAVFAIDLRGAGESAAGDNSDLPAAWVADARAAYATARNLPGVNPDQVVGIGASIGSDAVVDGCGDDCQGALSLSPGSYLGIPYAEAVTLLDEAGKPAWCVAAADDPEARPTCESAAGTHYQAHLYTFGGHAMQLFRAANDLEPPIEQIILDFLNLLFS